MSTKHRIPLLSRQQAMGLATEVATTGWKHRTAKGHLPAYYAKDVPDGELHVVDVGRKLFGGYALQHVADTGVVTNLGKKRGTLEDAKVAAVLRASKKGIRIMNSGRVENYAASGPRFLKGAIKHPGKLAKLADRLGFAKKPFMKRSLTEQKKVLDACVAEYGYRSCLGSTMLLRNFPAISRDPKLRARATALKDYLVSTYGGSGSFGLRRKNPADGKWDAVPAILMHVDLSGVLLTARQVTELTLETV